MSATMNDSPLVIFVVDTEQYAGNFERDMVAWMTGVIGECAVGEETALAAMMEMPPDASMWFDYHIRKVGDDHGCRRPASIWQSPESSDYNSVACFLDDEPPPDVLAVLKERAHSYAGNEWAPKPTITGFRLLRRTVTYASVEMPEAK